MRINLIHTRAWLESTDIDNPDSYDLGFVNKKTGELIGMGRLVNKSGEDLWTIGYNLRRD